MALDQFITGISICGAGHSGSTLLGMVLGSAPGAFYVGEGAKIRYLHDEKKPLKKRVCKICGEACEVWSGFHWNRNEPLYRQVAAHTASSIIVDSTKNPDWIEDRTAELKASGDRAVLVLLLRDGRAVINSRLRKYPDRDPEQQILDWMAQVDRSEALFAGFEGPKIRIRYEEFASDPETAARQICNLAGIAFRSEMLDFAARPHHPLGGNNGTQFLVARQQSADSFVSLPNRTRDYYKDHSGGISLDLRWKRELKPEHAALFEQVAGRFNTSLKWGE